MPANCKLIAVLAVYGLCVTGVGFLIDGCRSSPAVSYCTPVNPVGYSFGTTGRYRLWTMHILKRLFGRVDGPLLHGMLAGCVIMVISSLGRRAGVGALIAIALLAVLTGVVV